MRRAPGGSGASPLGAEAAGSGAGGPVSRGRGAAREARYPGAGPGRAAAGGGGGEAWQPAAAGEKRLLWPVGRGRRMLSLPAGGEGEPALLLSPERGKFTPVHPRSVQPQPGFASTHPVPVRPRPCPLLWRGPLCFYPPWAVNGAPRKPQCWGKRSRCRSQPLTESDPVSGRRGWGGRQGPGAGRGTVEWGRAEPAPGLRWVLPPRGCCGRRGWFPCSDR